jgi:hypothetical protein
LGAERPKPSRPTAAGRRAPSKGRVRRAELRPPAWFTRVTPPWSLSSQDGAVPVRRIARGGSGRRFGGFAEVPEEPFDVLRLSDEGEQAHAVAAAGTGLDVEAEGSAEQLGSWPVT